MRRKNLDGRASDTLRIITRLRRLGVMAMRVMFIAMMAIGLLGFVSMVVYVLAH